MSFFESMVWLIVGVGLVMGVPAMLYFFLPSSVLESAARHGRYAGLGTTSWTVRRPRPRATLAMAPLGQG